MMIWILFIQVCFVPSMFVIGPVILEKIFKKCQSIFTAYWYLPFVRDMVLHLNKLKSPHTRMHGAKFG